MITYVVIVIIIIDVISFSRINWDLFMLFLLILNMIVIPLDTAFFLTEAYSCIVAFNVLSDVSYTCDLLLNFRTGLDVHKIHFNNSKG